MAFSHGTPNSIVTDGLIFCVDAANKVSYPGSGTTCNGLINGIEGTLSTSNIFENSNNGVFGFDATSDYIDMDSNSIFSGENTTDGFCVSFWMKVTNVQSAVILGNLDLTNEWFQIAIQAGSNGIYFYDQDTGQLPVKTGNNFKIENAILNNWYNISVVYKWGDTSNSFILVNGEDLTSTKASVSKTSITGACPLRIGRRGASVWPFHGKLGPIQIYNRALSAQEVTQNYNALKNRFRT
jgi:hypothetical protein